MGGALEPALQLDVMGEIRVAIARRGPVGTHASGVLAEHLARREASGRSPLTEALRVIRPLERRDRVAIAPDEGPYRLTIHHSTVTQNGATRHPPILEAAARLLRLRPSLRSYRPGATKRSPLAVRATSFWTGVSWEMRPPRGSRNRSRRVQRTRRWSRRGRPSRCWA